MIELKRACGNPEILQLALVKHDLMNKISKFERRKKLWLNVVQSIALVFSGVIGALVGYLLS